MTGVKRSRISQLGVGSYAPAWKSTVDPEALVG